MLNLREHAVPRCGGTATFATWQVTEKVVTDENLTESHDKPDSKIPQTASTASELRLPFAVHSSTVKVHTNPPGTFRVANFGTHRVANFSADGFQLQRR